MAKKSRGRITGSGFQRIKATPVYLTVGEKAKLVKFAAAAIETQNDYMRNAIFQRMEKETQK